MAAPTPGGEVGPGEEEQDELALLGRVRLEGDLRAASAARSFSGQTCASWGVPAAAANTVVDLASELAGGHVQVSVSDGSSEPPRLLPYRPGVSERGIGLRLVDQLSESWGWPAVAPGKRVWARAEVSDGPPKAGARRVLTPRRRGVGTA